MSMAAAVNPSAVGVSDSAAPTPASAATTENWMAVKPSGRPNGEACPVMTTWAAQNAAENATSWSPDENEASVPPPSNQVPSADTATAGHTMGLGVLPPRPQAKIGVMTT